MKIMKRLSLGACLTGVLFAGMITAHAYTILCAGGFSPVPTKVVSFNGFSSSLNSAISNACSAWNSAGAGTLVTRSNSTHDHVKFPLKNGANEITYHEPGKNGNMMVTRLTAVKLVGTIAYNTEVDIDVNGSYAWSTTGDPNAYDFQNCITHEIGHLLGLNDEYSKTDSTMYSVTKMGETQKRTLAQDDKNGIGVIY